MQVRVTHRMQNACNMNQATGIPFEVAAVSAQVVKALAPVKTAAALLAFLNCLVQQFEAIVAWKIIVLHGVGPQGQGRMGSKHMNRLANQCISSLYLSG